MLKSSLARHIHVVCAGESKNKRNPRVRDAEAEIELDTTREMSPSELDELAELL
jgi:hypothetical protein